jgi:hypothetical protein
MRSVGSSNWWKRNGLRWRSASVLRNFSLLVITKQSLSQLRFLVRRTIWSRFAVQSRSEHPLKPGML